MSILTSREISEKFNPDLTNNQHLANEIYIDMVWQQLKMGGIWGYPAAGQIFYKVKEGWSDERIQVSTH